MALYDNLWVVVPAYHEEKRIGQVVAELRQAGFLRVVVVDDGSRDATAHNAQAAGAVVVRHVVNRGQGAALETGNRFACREGAEIIVHFDGDGQLHPGDIAGAVSLLQAKNVAVVLGSRFLDDRSTTIPWFKRYCILPIGRWINYVFTGVWLTDAHNGFRVLSRQAAEHMVITQDGMAHNTEIVAHIGRLRLPFAEFPVRVTYYEPGQGLRGGVKIVVDVLFDHLTR